TYIFYKSTIQSHILKLIISISKHFLIFITLFTALSVSGQVVPEADTTRKAPVGSTLPDSLAAPDTSLTDTIGRPGAGAVSGNTAAQKADPNALAAAINSSASDSTWMDYRNNVVHFFGNAKIKYEDFEITGDYIRI